MKVTASRENGIGALGLCTVSQVTTQFGRNGFCKNRMMLTANHGIECATCLLKIVGTHADTYGSHTD